MLLPRRPASARFLPDTAGFFTSLGQGNGRIPDGTEVRPKFLTQPAKKLSVGEIKHSITRHRLTFDVEVLEVQESQVAPMSDTSRLIAPDSVEEALVSNLDRKAWKLAWSHLHG